MIVITPATRQVDVRAASNGSPSGSRSGMPRNPRIDGFTKMMYDITMNVVTPAAASRPSVVRFSSNLKYRSSAEPPPAVVLCAIPSLPPSRRTARC